MYKDVVLTKYGYYQLKDKPSKESLSEYYREKYYQTSKGKYKKSYTPSELKFIENKLERKFEILNDHINNTEQCGFLDIGCGEGWALNFFYNKGLKVFGIDYSSHGCNSFNPEMIKFLKTGDIYQIIDEMISERVKFDIIQMDNVLEHVLEPQEIVVKLKNLLSDIGICIIEVPNDYSTLQKYLFENEKINSPFWVGAPDHISYFNKEGLTKLFHQNHFNMVQLSTDFPIDINLLNEDTNYYLNKNKGRNVHIARIEFENLLNSIDIIKTNQLYATLAELGVGRNIIAYFKHNEQ